MQLDLTSIYHQMKICEMNEWKTAFSIKYWYFKYQVMLFSLFNASASFKRYINKILAKKLNIMIIITLVNILIYTNKVNHVNII